MEGKLYQMRSFTWILKSKYLPSTSSILIALISQWRNYVTWLPIWHRRQGYSWEEEGWATNSFDYICQMVMSSFKTETKCYISFTLHFHFKVFSYSHFPSLSVIVRNWPVAHDDSFKLEMNQHWNKGSHTSWLNVLNWRSGWYRHGLYMINQVSWEN